MHITFSSSFNQNLTDLNSLDENIKFWLCSPDMLFGSANLWWQDRKKRPTLHEGLDLYSFQDISGVDHFLSPGFKITPIYPGQIVDIITDYIGYSIFLKHNITHEKEINIFSVYAHVLPAKNVNIGKTITPGEELATIAPIRGHKQSSPPHLHLTLFRTVDGFQPKHFSWKCLTTEKGYILIDPLDRSDWESKDIF